MAYIDHNHDVSRPFHAHIKSLCAEFDSLQLAYDELFKQTLSHASQTDPKSPESAPCISVVKPELTTSTSLSCVIHEYPLDHASLKGGKESDIDTNLPEPTPCTSVAKPELPTPTSPRKTGLHQANLKGIKGKLQSTRSDKGDCEEGGHVPETAMDSRSRAKTIALRLKDGAVGQRIQSTVSHQKSFNEGRSWGSMLKHFVRHPFFELFFAILILANAVVLCFEVQYRGFDIGYNMDYPTSPNPAATAWPEAKVWFDALMFFFGLAFTLELVLKIIVLRLDFVKTTWNWFDTIVVAGWLLEQIELTNLVLNPNLLRILRLVRLVRLTRLVNVVEAMDSLQVLIGSMRACVSVLCWSACVLLTITIITGMFLNGFLEFYMTSNSELLSDKQQVYKYFGSFTRTMVTMYEVTLGNWVPVIRLLMENVSQVYGPVLLLYRFVIGFAVVKVITGVFLHETFKVAASDDNLMVVQKQRQISKMKKKMSDLMAYSDKTGDGKIEKHEFLKALQNKWTRTWLSAMDLEVADGDLLFEFVDNGDGAVTESELFGGLNRLKGPARSIDLIALTFRFSALEEAMEELHKSCTPQGFGPQKEDTAVDSSQLQ